MGTINYGSNKILLDVGYDLSFNADNYNENLRELMNDNPKLETDELEEKLRHEEEFTQQCYFEGLDYEIGKVNLSYYKVEAKTGYYEGFYIAIDFNYYYLENAKAKREAQKELTVIKKLLIKAIWDYNCVVCYPSWCTDYENWEKSLKLINEAIKTERERIKGLHTWRTFSRLTREEKYKVTGWGIYR